MVQSLFRIALFWLLFFSFTSTAVVNEQGDPGTPFYGFVKSPSAHRWNARDRMVFTKFISATKAIITDEKARSSVLSISMESGVEEIARFSFASTERITDAFLIKDEQTDIYYIAAAKDGAKLVRVNFDEYAERAMFKIPLKKWRLRETTWGRIIIEDLSKENSFFKFDNSWDEIFSLTSRWDYAFVAKIRRINPPLQLLPLDEWNSSDHDHGELAAEFEQVSHHQPIEKYCSPSTYLNIINARCLSIGTADLALTGHYGFISIWTRRLKRISLEK